MINTAKSFGYPTSLNETKYYCISGQDALNHRELGSIYQDNTGITFEGYCDRATMIIRSFIASFAILIIVT